MTDDRSASESPTQVPPNRAPVIRRVLVGLVAGLAAGFFGMLVVAFLNRGEISPKLTPELFREAQAKWEESPPRNYNIEVKVQGNQPATYYVEVRDGDAKLALRNGQPLTQRRTFSTWSVPGMFATIARDVDTLERRASGQADKFTPNVNLRAAFDRHYSYPARYRRLQYQSSVEVEWEVTRFEVVAGERENSAAPAH